MLKPGSSVLDGNGQVFGILKPLHTQIVGDFDEETESGVGVLPPEPAEIHWKGREESSKEQCKANSAEEFVEVHCGGPVVV
jgi:hypothetical protein